MNRREFLKRASHAAIAIGTLNGAVSFYRGIDMVDESHDAIKVDDQIKQTKYELGNAAYYGRTVEEGIFKSEITSLESQKIAENTEYQALGGATRENLYFAEFAGSTALAVGGVIKRFELKQAEEFEVQKQYAKKIREPHKKKSKLDLEEVLNHDDGFGHEYGQKEDMENGEVINIEIGHGFKINPNLDRETIPEYVGDNWINEDSMVVDVISFQDERAGIWGRIIVNRLNIDMDVDLEENETSQAPSIVFSVEIEGESVENSVDIVLSHKDSQFYGKIDYALLDVGQGVTGLVTSDSWEDKKNNTTREIPFLEDEVKDIEFKVSFKDEEQVFEPVEVGPLNY